MFADGPSNGGMDGAGRDLVTQAANDGSLNQRYRTLVGAGRMRILAKALGYWLCSSKNLVIT
jgi:hypothetical protein